MQHFPGVVTTSRHLSGEPPHRICRTYNFRRTGHKWTIPDPGQAGIHYSPVQVMGSGMVRPPKAGHWIQRVTPELVLQQRHFSSELASCLSNVSLELREVSFASTCREPANTENSGVQGQREDGRSTVFWSHQGGPWIQSSLKPRVSLDISDTWANKFLFSSGCCELAFLLLENNESWLTCLYFYSLQFNKHWSSTCWGPGPVLGARTICVSDTQLLGVLCLAINLRFRGSLQVSRTRAVLKATCCLKSTDSGCLFWLCLTGPEQSFWRARKGNDTQLVSVLLKA